MSGRGLGAWGLALAAVAGLGCRARVAAPVPRTPVPVAAAAPTTGAVVDGVYVDREWPVRWVVPAGWSARAGASGGWRVRLLHADTGAAWELWMGPEAASACPEGWWQGFSATGPFRGPAVLPEAQVATCLSEPNAGAVWTWRPVEGPPWALRLWLPSQRPSSAVDAALEALRGLEWGGPG